MTLRVGIYLYPDVEVLDFAGPYEVFSTASRVAGRLDASAAELFAVLLLAETHEVVRARGGLRVLPDASIHDAGRLDVLLVPGGVHGPELGRPEVIAWLARAATSSRLAASVCTGAFLLARAGLLSGLEVTTHWEDCADLQRAFPDLRVRDGVRWIENDHILTSAGISAGIDMSLRMVARLASEELAERTARQMDYAWRARSGSEP